MKLSQKFSVWITETKQTELICQWDIKLTHYITVVSCTDVSHVGSSIHVTDIAHIHFDSFSSCWKTLNTTSMYRFSLNT